MSDEHVHTLMCPKCGRMWTGRFVAPFPEQEVCVDCIREGEGDAAESKDLSIQQMKHLHKKDKK